mgnify:CR=1 FL=1
MSSDSGSAGNFREMEDGFAAYAASKAALNMAVRHMAAELKRKDDDTIILCMHPGEVATDMANIQVTWDVQGIITPEESVTKMIEVIKSKGIQHSGTFWTYENQVSHSFPRQACCSCACAYFASHIHGDIFTSRLQILSTFCGKITTVVFPYLSVRLSTYVCLRPP